MIDEPPAPLMEPYEALRIIQVFVDVAAEADTPCNSEPTLREIRAVLAMALPKKPKRRRRKA